ncbi:MAG: hypothetical protein HOQ24_19510 [Mycobacteriaceae bacterium]|nr:hypothetical protein [Mycobacteriaceae bacterium]
MSPLSGRRPGLRALAFTGSVVAAVVGAGSAAAQPPMPGPDGPMDCRHVIVGPGRPLPPELPPLPPLPPGAERMDIRVNPQLPPPPGCPALPGRPHIIIKRP